MRLKSLRVRNFRTVVEEQTLEFPRSLTIVGPNNTGKTNLLSAVRMLYTGLDNLAGYSRAKDLSLGKGREQTTLVATLEKSTVADEALLAKYDQLLGLYEPVRIREGDEIVLQLIFSERGNPTYRLSSESTSKVAREHQATHSRLLRDLVIDLVDSTSVHFVPSSNSSEDLFRDLVSPLIKRSVASGLATEIAAMTSALSTVSSELTTIIEAAGLPGYKVDFELPGQAQGSFLSHFDFFLADPARTSAFVKGRGIQALAMLACFVWIAEQEGRSGKSSIWLIEEPESYLHPELYATALDLLARIEQHGQVIRTTHALTMVPRDAQAITGTAVSPTGSTVLRKFTATAEATTALRGSLGVKFADFFGLGPENVFTEGDSDIHIVKWATVSLGAATVYPRLSEAHFRSFGGVKNLEGFLHANYLHIRPETSAVSLFDGDDAGLKAIRAVQSYLGNHGSGFDAGVDYVITRTGHPVEGLFPDTYLTEMHDSSPSWFTEWIPDPSGAVASFRLQDAAKVQAQNWLRAKADAADSTDEWSALWTPLLASLENALATWRPGRR
jgi:putative ATP-dependent endonuclease of OLD family